MTRCAYPFELLGARVAFRGFDLTDNEAMVLACAVLNSHPGYALCVEHG